MSKRLSRDLCLPVQFATTVQAGRFRFDGETKGKPVFQLARIVFDAVDQPPAAARRASGAQAPRARAAPWPAGDSA